MIPFKITKEHAINQFLNFKKSRTFVPKVFGDKKEVEKIAVEIAEKTHVYENITVKGGKEVKATTTRTLLQDTIKFFKEFYSLTYRFIFI